MSLTSKQETFAQAVASGMSQVDAYRSSYNVSDTAKPEGLYVDASKLMSDPNIALRVTLLKDEIAAKALWTRLDSVTALRGVVDAPFSKGAEITGAVKVLNEMHGYNAPVKIEHSGTITKIELVALDDDSTS
jgi:hypothetical protein